MMASRKTGTPGSSTVGIPLSEVDLLQAKVACRSMGLTNGLTISFKNGRTAMLFTMGMTDNTNWLYSPTKAAQVVAYFALRATGRSIEKLKAMKLVYLADRESIRRSGAPILDEPRYSLRLGPVNQMTLTCADRTEDQSDGWSHLIGVEEDRYLPVKAGVEIATLDELSEADIDAMDSVWKQHGHKTGFQLANWTHRPGNIPEWRDPGGSRLSIDIADIMKNVGLPDAQGRADQLAAHRRAQALFDSI